MQANEYQRLCLVTESPATPINGAVRGSRLLHSAIGVCTEAGELQDALKKDLFYGKPADHTNIVEEYGDLLWYIAIGLDTLGVSMEDCMERNIAKLKARYPAKFDAHQAINRDLAAERKALEEKQPEPFPLPPVDPLNELDEAS